MSQEKAQLIAPIGIMTVTGMTATGVITATSFTGNVVGSAKSLVNGTDVTAGVVTGTSFVGNLTGNIQRLADSAPNINVGVTTATSFVGNLTGSVTDLTSQPAITVGLVTATSLSGPITGNVTGDVDGDVTGNVTGTIAGNVTGNVTGNATGTSGGLGVNYNGGWTGAGTSQVRAGVVTATFFHGDGSNLEGVSSGPVSQQAVTIDGAATSIDLSNGNLIYATQSANTTVSFANSENGNVYFVRTKDDNTTARTITWPDRINWEGGTAPTLVSSASANDAQVLLLVTRNMGVTWYGKEIVNIDPVNTMWGWGDNEGGGLGLNDTADRSSPVQVGTNSSWSKLTTSLDLTLNSGSAIKSDGTLWVWGNYYQGLLGLNQGANGNISSPTQVGTDTTWNNIAMSRTTWATKTDGTLWSWGYNVYGQLGQNNRIGCSSPVQLPGTDWSTVGQGYSTKFAIKTDGTMWGAGSNNNGYLGQNTSNPGVANISSPVQVPGTTWSKVLTFQDGVLALKTDNTLWSWGAGTTSGQGDYGKRSSPTQIPGTIWSDVGAGYNGAGAIRSDGTLWTWGNNANGQLGLNDRTNRPSPVQVPGTTWRSIHGTYDWMAATKTDGTLWVWGWDDYGKFGQNRNPHSVRISSPTQVGTATDWKTEFSATGRSSLAFRQG